MLTKMPQVGDKVKALRSFLDVTEGVIYTVTSTDRDGDAEFTDDTGVPSSMYIDEDYFDDYELVSEVHDATPQQPVGRITIEDVRQSTKVSADGQSETSYAFTVYADADGYDAVERLADASAKQDQRADIERQIAALQKELAAL